MNVSNVLLELSMKTLIHGAGVRKLKGRDVWRFGAAFER